MHPKAWARDRMAGLIPSVGRFGQASAWGLFAFLAVWYFPNVAPNAECAKHPDTEPGDGFKNLFEQASPYEPVQVDSFLSHNAALHRVLHFGDDEGLLRLEQATPEAEPEETNDASFIAKDKIQGPLGFLLGHVDGDKGVLDSLSIITDTNIEAVVTSLGERWFKNLEERGVSEVLAQTLASDVEQLNQLQLLGFFPTGVSHSGSSAFKAVNLRTRLSLMGMGGALTAKGTYIHWKIPLPYDNGSSTYAYERMTELRDVLIPKAKRARIAAGVKEAEEATTDESEEGEQTEAAVDEKGQAAEAAVDERGQAAEAAVDEKSQTAESAVGEKGQKTEAAKGEKSKPTEAAGVAKSQPTRSAGDAKIRLAEIAVDERTETGGDESDETDTTADGAKEETEEPAPVEGKPFVLEELELVEYTEDKKESIEALANKAGKEQRFLAAELEKDKQHVFIVKTKGESPRLKAFAVAKVLPDQNSLLVSKIHVSAQCEGNAMLLLAKAINKKAYELDVESTTMYISTSAVSSWNSATQAGFTVRNHFKGRNLPSGRNRQKCEDTFELCLDRTARPKDSFSTYLEMEQLEYQLEQLINGKPKGLKSVTASEEDAAYLLHRASAGRIRARRVRDAESAAVTGLQWTEGLMLIGIAVVVHLLLVALIRSYESHKRKQGKQYGGRGMRGSMRDEMMALQWDWQPAPTFYEEERSSELDEFYVDTQASDSFAPGITVSP